ncbi:MAG: class I SAM-dependent methyltransferase [Stigonema ocellatum SAG 48.90 = DSM 106950]|nr:class I SAM-dependent methyltransferase [Stigonema ocellatum SAG 48.90 = DSM 106950]
MMNVIRRVANKLSQVPGLHTPVLWTEETLRHTLFKINQTNHDLWYIEFKSCQTAEDYYEYSNKYIGMHQIKSEILNFIDFLQPCCTQNICEIGTADGGTNFLLFHALQSVKLMAGVDLFVRNQFQLKYFAKPTQSLFFINGSSYDPCTVQQVSQILGDSKLDLLFIDGDHNYDGVKRDFLMYRHLVKESGIIAFHDIIPDYKTRYGKNTFRWAGGVPIFWKELKQMYQSFEFIEDPEQDSYGIGAIYYSEAIHLPTSW